MSIPDWWSKPREISVVVDNDSWILPYAEKLVNSCNEQGDNAHLCRNHDDIKDGAVAFYLGCVKITPPEILAKNKKNLVVHASDLPDGRGFSPWSYAVLEGKDKFPVCLIEAVDKVDAGDIFYKEYIHLQGDELVNDLRHLIGNKTLALCQKFLNEPKPILGIAQKGEGSIYKRRYPKDSQLDINKTIKDQFDLLRIVDNKNYPAFFEYQGQRYKLSIEKDDRVL